MLACIKYGADADGKITKTKLAKLMYLSDFAYFAENGVSITNAKYLKLQQGPVPLEYFSCIKNLNEISKIHIEKKGKSDLISAVKTDEVLNFDADEKELIKKVCKKWQGKNTEAIVEFTHKQLPWAISFEGQEVPYSLIIQEEHVY